MTRLCSAALLLCCCVAALAGGVVPAKPAVEARARIGITGDGRDPVMVSFSHDENSRFTLSLPAGRVLEAADGTKLVVLRSLQVELEPRTSFEATVPVAALSSGTVADRRVFSVADAHEPRVAALVKILDGYKDVPRATAQLAVFILMEDMDWPAWLAHPSGGKPAREASTADVAQVVDALALVRLAHPEKKCAMLANEELKRLALRSPATRAKAMALYGMKIEDAITGEPAAPPDLRQLLHTAPDDNCPVCRMRAKAGPDIP